MIPQPLRDLARDTWEVVRDIAGPAGRTARLSWREAMRILRRSLVPVLVERVIGICIFSALVAVVVMILQLMGFIHSVGK